MARGGARYPRTGAVKAAGSSRGASLVCFGWKANAWTGTRGVGSGGRERRLGPGCLDRNGRTIGWAEERAWRDRSGALSHGRVVFGRRGAERVCAFQLCRSLWIFLLFNEWSAVQHTGLLFGPKSVSSGETLESVALRSSFMLGCVQ